MTTRISIAARNAALNGVLALANGGTVQIRTGAQPATPETAATGTLLGTLTLSNPAFGAAANGSATANTVTGDSSADATGTAGWFRVLNSSSAAVWDGAITATGGGGEMTMDSTSIVTGGAINLNSWTFGALAG